MIQIRVTAPPKTIFLATEATAVTLAEELVVTEVTLPPRIIRLTALLYIVEVAPEVPEIPEILPEQVVVAVRAAKL